MAVNYIVIIDFFWKISLLALASKMSQKIFLPVFNNVFIIDARDDVDMLKTYKTASEGTLSYKTSCVGKLSKNDFSEVLFESTSTVSRPCIHLTGVFNMPEILCLFPEFPSGATILNIWQNFDSCFIEVEC